MQWSEHGDGRVDSIYKRKDAELVQDVGSINDGGEQPVEVAFIDTLRKEGDDFEERSSVWTKLLKHRGGEGEFDRRSEALVMHCPQHPRPLPLPFSRQSICVPFVLMRNSGEQGDRKRMEV